VLSYGLEQTQLSEDKGQHRFGAKSSLAVASRWLYCTVGPVASSIREKGDKNKIPVSNAALRSADFGGRTTPSDQGAWGVFVTTKTHLAT
jgi:hypothetical protein